MWLLLRKIKQLEREKGDLEEQIRELIKKERYWIDCFDEERTKRQALELKLRDYILVLPHRCPLLGVWGDEPC